MLLVLSLVDGLFTATRAVKLIFCFVKFNLELGTSTEIEKHLGKVFRKKIDCVKA